ncbi:hypothetical protein NTE_02540 [Candidatus Nitrososphaera evergladensis SR1]|uniref:Uncharacterized protein n=2 Tax=Nitrososphaera TaxID=497726 RepID=A0A075MVA1_9ARCH|nr:hypothetical protein NTE_02540 [Candidatus Nitrososphaera evergladensis SR1]
MIIERGVDFLEKMAGVQPKKPEQKQFGVYFSPEEIQLLEIYARELFNDGYISRNSIGSLCRFCTIAFLKNSQNQALENVRARQAAQTKESGQQ